MPTPPSKSALRAHMRERLAGLVASSPAQYWKDASLAVCRSIPALPELASARLICGFVATQGELDPAPLLQAVWAAHRKVALPRVDWQQRSMQMAIVNNLSADLVPTHHGLRQPKITAPHVSPEGNDLILVPGLAFDAAGGRLGRGAGYYDRFLRVYPEAWRCGVCLDEQVVGAVPMDEAQDVRMHFLATPTRLLDCRTPGDLAHRVPLGR